jgi:hypothetical protein
VPQSPLFTATVDEARATIRTRGHLDRLGADLLRGTVEALQRRGHRRITLQLQPLATADLEARVVLSSLARQLSTDGAQLLVR